MPPRTKHPQAHGLTEAGLRRVTVSTVLRPEPFRERRHGELEHVGAVVMTGRDEPLPLGHQRRRVEPRVQDPSEL